MALALGIESMLIHGEVYLIQLCDKVYVMDTSSKITTCSSNISAISVRMMIPLNKSIFTIVTLNVDQGPIWLN